MATNQELLTDLRNKVIGVQTRLLAISPNDILYSALGEYIVFGCKVTQGASTNDSEILLAGQDSGDTDNLNPDLAATPTRGYQYPNIASLKDGAFRAQDLTADVEAAPATGTARYDIAYIYVGASGAGFAIAAGTPSSDVKNDFDTYGLDTSDFGEYSADPSIPVGAYPVARIYVEDVYTGIQDARIADLRSFQSVDIVETTAYTFTQLQTFSGGLSGVLGATGPAAVTATALTATVSASLPDGSVVNGELQLSSTVPRLLFNDTDQSANRKKWSWGYGTGQLVLSALSDDELTVRNGLVFDKSGSSIVNIFYGNSSDNPGHTFYGDLILGTSGKAFDAAANGGIFKFSVTTGITAGTTQTQAGATATTTDFNVIDTVGNANDGVKLPTAVKGRRVTYRNNGANAAQIWPASSDAIDGGSADAVDSNALAANAARTYEAADATNWYTVSNS